MDYIKIKNPCSQEKNTTKKVKQGLIMRFFKIHSKKPHTQNLQSVLKISYIYIFLKDTEKEKMAQMRISEWSIT